MGEGPPDVEHRRLRSALEFAVTMAGEAQKGKIPLAVPKDVAAHVGSARLPNSALGRVRRAIERDPTFRERVGRGAVPELVDEIGRLWLQRPTGWEQQVDELVSAAAEDERAGSLRRQLARAEKRRLAAERVAARSRAELTDRDERIAELTRTVDELRADVVKAHDEREEARAELIDARNEARHARDREAAAVARLAAAEHDRDRARERAEAAGTVRDEALAARADAVASVAEVESAAHAARALAIQLESLLPTGTGDDAIAPTRPAERTPLAIPGGVRSASPEAAEQLVRSDAAVLIDGYNVAKLGWPAEPLAAQRDRLLDAVENLARRFATDVTVVFDGTSVIGAHTRRRRLVRVVYSPEGVIADDVIRDEVRRLPTSRPVVVVTNDAEIVRDVRAAGANTVRSDDLLAIL
jgi:predicted RNA-binding protein with PIN domain